MPKGIYKRTSSPWNKGLKGWTEGTKAGYQKGHTMSSGKNNPAYTHGLRKTKFYKVFHHLKDRCNSVRDKSYVYYGSRGIKCLWKNFIEFRNDMYKSYLVHVKKYGYENTFIDRINNNGNYCKDNCRWATRIENNNNKRCNYKFSINGERKTITEWANIYKINRRLVYKRIYYCKWDIITALTQKRYGRCQTLSSPTKGS